MERKRKRMEERILFRKFLRPLIFVCQTEYDSFLVESQYIFTSAFLLTPIPSPLLFFALPSVTDHVFTDSYRLLAISSVR